MKKEYIRNGLILIIFILLLIFVYPTLYRFDKYDQKIPVRINRITGKTELLSYNGWIVAAPTTTPLVEATAPPSAQPTQEPIVTYNGETYKQYYARVLKETPGETLPNSSSLFIRWERVRLGIDDKLVEPKDYFTIGSTKEYVKKIMGPPSSIDDYLDRWYYNTDSIEFKSGKVKEYNNSSSKLLVR